MNEYFPASAPSAADHETAPTASSKSPQEVELKLRIRASDIERLWASPSLVAAACGPRRVTRMTSQYHDTPRRELVGAGMVLRLRRSGRQWLQTLKTTGGADGPLSRRGEWEMALPGPSLQLSRFADTPLPGVASLRSLARRIAPVFTTEFRRETQRLRIGDRLVVELAVDVGCVWVGRGRSRRSAEISEVELEVVESDPDESASRIAETMFRFAGRLARDVPLVPLSESKAARGYRVADHGHAAAVSVSLPRPRADEPARLFLSRVLAAGNAALLANAHAILESRESAASAPPTGHTTVADPAHLVDLVDPVHQARVAIRRMRSALALFRPVVRSRRSTDVDDALKRLGAVFGRARDRDVYATTTRSDVRKAFGDDETGRAALSTVDARFALQRAEAHAAIGVELEQGAFGLVTLAVERLVARLQRPEPADFRVDACAARWLEQRYDRTVQRARRLASLDREARHRLRIEVKRLRYALDLFEPLYEAEAAGRFGDALADLQKRLGTLNDQTVALEAMEALPRQADLDCAIARYTAWLDAKLEKRLPKVAARSVALELTPKPWSDQRPRAFR